uniref:Uncharacterized protein n=1 Tax=Knipowitschia caucasica TaxID=637954 RepID=A0AAV2J567_KNICA
MDILKFPKHLIPEEAFCHHCPNRIVLSDPVCITHKAISGIVEDISTYYKSCPQCTMMYRYQEWSSGLHNFNDHVILEISLCLTIRHMLQVHTAVSRIAEYLELSTGVKFPSPGIILHGYLHFEALTDHEYQYSCVTCGDHPPVVIMDLHRKTSFHLSGKYCLSLIKSIQTVLKVNNEVEFLLGFLFPEPQGAAPALSLRTSAGTVAMSPAHRTHLAALLWLLSGGTAALLLYCYPLLLYLFLLLLLLCGVLLLLGPSGALSARPGGHLHAVLRRWARAWGTAPRLDQGRNSGKGKLSSRGSEQSYGLLTHRARPVDRGLYRVDPLSTELFSPRDVLMGSYLSRADSPPQENLLRGRNPRQQLRDGLAKPNYAVYTPNRRLSFAAEPVSTGARFTITPQRHYPLQQQGASPVGVLPPFRWDGFRQKSVLSPRNSVCSPVTVKIGRPDAAAHSLESPVFTQAPVDPCSRESVLKVLRENRKREVDVEEVEEESSFSGQHRSKRRRNDSGGSAQSAFEPLLPNGMTPQLIPKPGTLKRGLAVASEEQSLKRSRTSSVSSSSGAPTSRATPSSRRNPISSSYSSSKGLGQRKRPITASPLSSPGLSRAHTPECSSKKTREENPESPSPEPCVQSERGPGVPPEREISSALPADPGVSSREGAGSGGKRRRKIQLMTREESLNLPPPPELGYTITVKDLDDEKRNALDKIHKLLETPSAEPASSSGTMPAVSVSLSTASTLSLSVGAVTSMGGSAAPAQTNILLESLKRKTPAPASVTSASLGSGITSPAGGGGTSSSAVSESSSVLPSGFKPIFLPSTPSTTTATEEPKPAHSFKPIFSSVSTSGSTFGSTAAGTVPPSSSQNVWNVYHRTICHTDVWNVYHRTICHTDVWNVYHRAICHTNVWNVYHRAICHTDVWNVYHRTICHTNVWNVYHCAICHTDVWNVYHRTICHTDVWNVYHRTICHTDVWNVYHRAICHTDVWNVYHRAICHTDVWNVYHRAICHTDVWNVYHRAICHTDVWNVYHRATCHTNVWFLYDDVCSTNLWDFHHHSSYHTNVWDHHLRAVSPTNVWRLCYSISPTNLWDLHQTVCFTDIWHHNHTSATQMFGATTASAPLSFGTTPTAAATQMFGTTTTLPPPPPYGTNTSTQAPPTFGSAASTQAPPTFGSAASTQAPPTFGSAASTQAPPTFGSAASTQAPPTFGSAASTQAPPTFGSTSTTQAPPTFGSTSSTQAPSTFGGTSSQSFIFGKSSLESSSLPSSFGSSTEVPKAFPFGAAPSTLVQTVRVDAAPSVTPSFGTKPSFSFGSSTAAAPQSAGTFNFGSSSQPAPPSNTQPPTQFNFGAAAPVQFGAPTNNAGPQMGFSFGATNSDKSAFGTTAPVFRTSAPAPIPFGSPGGVGQSFNSAPFGSPSTPSFSIGAGSKPSAARQRLQARRPHTRKK